MHVIIVEPTDDTAEPAVKKNKEENGMFITYISKYSTALFKLDSFHVWLHATLHDSKNAHKITCVCTQGP